MNEPTVKVFAADRLPEYLAIIEKANKRLRRAGAPEEFKPVISEPFLQTIKLESGAEVLVEYVTASLDEFKLSLGDYTFVASLVPEEAGITIHTAPGESLDGYRPEEFGKCDHCQVKRYRTRNYIVRDEKDGSLIQLGHNCIELFTGLKPKGLWALDFTAEQLAQFDEDEGGFGGGGYGSREYAIMIDTVLRLAYVYSDGGRSYLSVAKAREWDKAATVDMVRGHLFSPPKPQYNKEAYEEYLAKGREAAALSDEILDAIKASAETLSADSEYGYNMRTILAAPSGAVGYRNVGVLGSLVAVYRRLLGLEAKAKANPPVTGYLADKGQRVKSELRLTLSRVRFIPGNYGTTTLLVGKSQDGHMVEWFASGTHNYDEGDVLIIKAYTVKDQKPAGSDQYTKQDVTVITRAAVLAVIEGVAA